MLFQKEKGPVSCLSDSRRRSRNEGIQRQNHTKSSQQMQPGLKEAQPPLINRKRAEKDHSRTDCAENHIQNRSPHFSQPQQNPEKLENQKQASQNSSHSKAKKHTTQRPIAHLNSLPKKDIAGLLSV